ncbi:hypothetical protein PHLGIDRAFT_117661 [Phlebiopsis gigantea 11061_1 CR5-6]|uniref:Uncharacterized protein n=1 Tax=Phlebiopsis gigantea (strain 11061_1 CR5-6) TaxID=745531 RepID=A0A0C3S909_PHLG1|nr:hypothetical protein PHLGIDRAFT_117661 [Phlebiopsis gigantea 11061_1 CR5-6]
MLLEVLYFLHELGAACMSMLASLEAGDPAPFDTLSVDFGVLGFIDSRMPAACGDSAGRAKAALEQAKDEYDVLVNDPGFIAGMWWPALPGPCTNWNITAKDQFNASFSTSTKNALLLISTTFDSLTPILIMSEGPKGSVLLQQNSTGRSSLSGFSTGTALAVRADFAAGTLPALCQADTQMFVDPTNASGDRGIAFPSRRAVFERSNVASEEGGREFEGAVRGLREAGSEILRRRFTARQVKVAWGRGFF